MSERIKVDEVGFPVYKQDEKSIKVVEKNFSYHAPKEDQPLRYIAIRDEGKQLATLISLACPDSREKSLALTKLEEAVMWANASIARNE